MASILVTGANGFIGRALCEELAERNRCVRPVVRAECELPGRQPSCVIGDIGANTDWSAALSGVSEVVHLASRVHVMQEGGADSLAIYREVNTNGTLNLARQAAMAGVRRFVFVSSAKVSGEGAAAAYRETDEPSPVGSYAISKCEAEQGLRRLAENSCMEVVIVRPPLVYGPGVRANFLNLMRWLYRGVPLPLGAIHNKRSLVALGNVVDFLITCIDDPAAGNQTFFVSDGEDLSTTELLVRMAAALGKPARLIPVPSWMLTTGATLIGKRDLSQRLCENLQVDISKSKQLLGWSPPISVDDGLRVTAAHFLAAISGQRST